MASAFTHLAIPLVMQISSKKKVSVRLFVVSLFLCVAPDLDSIGLYFGIPYYSQWGHRAYSHSLLFAVGVSTILTLFTNFFRASRGTIFLWAILSMASHGLLDAMTDGGGGVAFFWPFDVHRYFLPWQVIRVSPMKIDRFFTSEGLVVLKSEFMYVWIPCIFIAAAMAMRNRSKETL